MNACSPLDGPGPRQIQQYVRSDAQLPFYVIFFRTLEAISLLAGQGCHSDGAYMTPRYERKPLQIFPVDASHSMALAGLRGAYTVGDRLRGVHDRSECFHCW